MNTSTYNVSGQMIAAISMICLHDNKFINMATDFQTDFVHITQLYTSYFPVNRKPMCQIVLKREIPIIDGSSNYRIEIMQVFLTVQSILNKAMKFTCCAKLNKVSSQYISDFSSHKTFRSFRNTSDIFRAISCIHSNES